MATQPTDVVQHSYTDQNDTVIAKRTGANAYLMNGGDDLITFPALASGEISAATVLGGPGYDTIVLPGVRSQYQFSRTVQDGAPILSAIFTDAGSGLGVGSEAERFVFAGEPTRIVDQRAWTATDQEIYRLYAAAFDRIPDRAGLEYWSGRGASGVTVREMAGSFLDSPESVARYGADPSDSVLVNAFYRNVLDRPGEASGVQYYLDRLRDGVSRAEVLMAFSESPENKEKTAADTQNGFLLADPDAARLIASQPAAITLAGVFQPSDAVPGGNTPTLL